MGDIMPTDLSTRKPINKVTREDFAIFPVWEWAIDEEGEEGQDESFVRPTTHTSIPNGSFIQFVVAAEAKLRNRETMPACVEVTIKGKTKSFEPLSVLLLDRHLDFAGMETTRLLSRYTKEIDNYPAAWKLKVPFEGEKKLRSASVRRSLAFLRLFELWWKRKFGKTAI